MDLGFEVPKELADRVYRLVEKSKVDGKFRKGSNEVTKSVERNEAKLVVIAEDVNPAEIVMHLPIICKEKEISIISVPAKEELGASVGLPVGTAAVAVVDAGSGKSLLISVIKDLTNLQTPTKKVEKEPVKEEKPVEKKEEKPVEKEPVKEEKKEEPVKEEPVKEKKAE